MNRSWCSLQAQSADPSSIFSRVQDARATRGNLRHRPFGLLRHDDVTRYKADSDSGPDCATKLDSHRRLSFVRLIAVILLADAFHSNDLKDTRRVAGLFRSMQESAPRDSIPAA
jgi:hypothetical protein